MADNVNMESSVEAVQELIQRKDRIEEELKALHNLLTSQNNVGMIGSLVDSEDYPRQDIDIPSIRLARNQIICLQNDHKSIMKQIEEGLHAVHAAAREKKRDCESGRTVVSDESNVEELQTAFSVVDHVSPNSPAENAGLQVGDQIINFGSVNFENFQNLQVLASVVQHSKGQSLDVLVRRNNITHRLNLIPAEWSGRGLIGCNIVPLKK